MKWYHSYCSGYIVSRVIFWYNKNIIFSHYLTKGENNMNKTELLTAMAETSGLAKKDCDAALSAFIDTVEAALKSGDKVQLVGFGTFEAKERAARTGKNPATGATIEIAASKAPVFKAGKAFKDSIQ